MANQVAVGDSRLAALAYYEGLMEARAVNRVGDQVLMDHSVEVHQDAGHQVGDHLMAACWAEVQDGGGPREGSPCGWPPIRR